MTGTLKAKVDGVWVPIAGSGGGTGTDEVWVGTDDPMAANPTVELWYDSDAPTPAAVDRWNSAWGIIAMGSFIPPYAPHVVSVTGALTNPLAATLITGRRYRIYLQCRAVNPTGAATSVSFFLRDNGTDIRSWQYGGDPYIYGAGNYTTAAFEWLYNGDNTSHRFEVIVDPGYGANVFTNFGLWYIEDVGPISYGTPPAVDPTPIAVAWTPITPINGWVAPGSSEIQPGYRKVGDVVQLKGSIQAGASVALGQAAFILPAGYYNTVITRVSMVGFSPSGVSIPVRADCINTGSFIIQSMNNATINTSYLQLNGVSWPVGVT